MNRENQIQELRKRLEDMGFLMTYIEVNTDNLLTIGVVGSVERIWKTYGLSMLTNTELAAIIVENDYAKAVMELKATENRIRIINELSTECQAPRQTLINRLRFWKKETPQPEPKDEGKVGL